MGRKPMLLKVDISRRIIAVLVAAWVPFCCCFIQAAHAIANPDNVGTAYSCCSNGACQPGTSTDSEPSDTEHEDSCTNCCLRVLPDAPQMWEPPIDLFGQPMLQDEMPYICVEQLHAVANTRMKPPDPPPGASLLQQRCLLLV